jgi:integrase
LAITKDRIDGYIGSRRKAGAKDATIHTEIAALSKMFTCAIEAGKLTAAQRPMFPSLGKLHNARTGMFEEAEFRKVLSGLSDDLKPFVEAAHWSGWRKRELLNLRWSQIDFMRGEMKLSGEHSKNGQLRIFPFSELKPLADVLYRQRARTDAVEKEIGRKVEFVFHRHGKMIKEYYGAWPSACKRRRCEWSQGPRLQKDSGAQARMGWRAPRDSDEADRARDFVGLRPLCHRPRQGPTCWRRSRRGLHRGSERLSTRIR